MARPLRIAITSEFYHPLTGGAETVVRRLAEHLASRGHDVTVLTSAHARRREEVLEGVAIAGFGISGNLVKGIHETRPGEAARYLEAVRRAGADVIIQYALQTWHTDLLFPHLDEYPAAKILVPCGLSALATTLRRVLYGSWLRRLPGWMGKYDRLVYHHADYLDKRFGDRNGLSRYDVIPNGVDISEIRNAEGRRFRESCGIGARHVLLNVSNHYALKGHHLLRRLSRTLPRDFSMVVIGDRLPGGGGCFDACNRRARKTPSFLVFHGLPRGAVCDAFAACDAYLLASRIEVFPLTILEAMAAGKPFISTPVGCVASLGHPLLAEGERGFASAIDLLFRDREKRIEIGRRNGEAAMEYDWPRILPRYEETIERALARKHTAREGGC